MIDIEYPLKVLMFKLYKIVQNFCGPPLPHDIRLLIPMLTTDKKRHNQVLQMMARIYNPHRDSYYLTDARKKLLKGELEKYIGKRSRKDKIASIAWIITKLNMQKQCRQMLTQIADRVSKDQWYVNFDEAVKAMEGFTWIQDKELREDIYERIERNVDLTIWEVNMTYYYRLSEALVKAKRLDSPLWDKLEYHILNNLSMDYDTKVVLDILHNFVLANKGSRKLYFALQQTIYKGHLFQQPYLLQGIVRHNYSSQLVSTLFSTFGMCNRQKGMPIDNDFSQYILNVLNHQQFQLEQLSHVVKIFQNLEPFEYGGEINGQVQQRLYRQIKTIKGYIRLPQVIEFYERIQYMGLVIPKQVVEDISILCLRSILYGPRRLSQTLQVYSYLQRHQLTGNQLFIPLVQQWLERQGKYFDKDELKLLIETMAGFNKKIESKNTNITIIGANHQKSTNLIP